MIYGKTKRSSDKLVIGDVVVIKDNTTTPRSKWKQGRVKSLIKGLFVLLQKFVFRPSTIHGAVLTSSTNSKLIDISRQLQKLIPLEVCDNSSIEPAHENEQIVISERPRRNAARIGELVTRTAVME